MSVVAQVELAVRAASDAYRDSAHDHYDFWQEHIVYVYREALALAAQYGADRDQHGFGRYFFEQLRMEDEDEWVRLHQLGLSPSPACWEEMAETHSHASIF